ncbi:hypothetical protein K474DRAFT_1595686 [Panus rudis PR-1116 ss-1]|nr:hypothetical protein K474DRAFT_1595686 [Panus rudis PR-1116 ss-1]
MLRESSIIKILSPHLPFDTLASKIRVTPTFLVGSALLITGSLIRIACYRTLGRQFTFSLSLQKEHKLITNGPYSIVRHPSYLGTAIYNVGHILVQMGSGSWWRESGIGSTTIGRVLGLGRVGFSAFIVLMLWMRIPSEDLVMKNEFGEHWEAWTKKTPYKLVPGIY